MSAETAEREFDDDLVQAAELLIDEHGVDGAIDELIARRHDGDETGRVTEALAWIKRFERGEQT